MKGAGLIVLIGPCIRVGWVRLVVRCKGYHHLKDYWIRNKWPAASGVEYGKGGCPPAGAAMRASGCPRVLL